MRTTRRMSWKRLLAEGGAKPRGLCRSPSAPAPAPAPPWEAGKGVESPYPCALVTKMRSCRTGQSMAGLRGPPPRVPKGQDFQAPGGLPVGVGSLVQALPLPQV